MTMIMDLNADVGEDAAALADSREEALLRQITSANIACGGHAGDPATMEAVVRLAVRHGVAVGAHPGYPDRANFGRTVLDIPRDDLAASLYEQVRALGEIARRQGVSLAHVKPHGALYNAAASDPALAATIAAAAGRWSRDLTLVGLAGSDMLNVWRAEGFAVAAEAFADRRYEPDGSLRPRRFSDALLTDPEEAADQALEIAVRARVRAWDGVWVPIRAVTLCLHGDSPGAAATAAAIRRRLEAGGVRLAPLVEQPPSSSNPFRG
jgi:UPF0271 protein